MAQILVDRLKMQQIESDLAGIRGGLNQALRLAVWDTTKQVRTDTSTRIRKKVKIKKKEIDPQLDIQHPKVESGTIKGKMTLDASDRLPLKYFNARKTKKGVTYQIDQQGGRVRGADLFIVDSLHEHVFARLPGSQHTKGRSGRKKKRGAPKGKRKTPWMWPELPIGKKLGVSPYGVVKKNELEKPIADAGSVSLMKNLDRRVNFLILKQQGKLSWQTRSSN